MTRILVDGRVLDGGASGVRDVAIGLVKGLVELSRAQEFEIIIAGTQPAAEARIRALGFMQVGLPTTALRRRCDVVLVPRQTRPPLSLIRCVPLIHDVGFERVPEIYPRDPRVTAANRMALCSKRLLAVSAFTAEEVRTLRTDRSPDVLPLAAIHRIDWDPAIDDRYVLCVAAQEPHKNLARLVEAWARADTAECRLVICGRPGRATAQLNETIALFAAAASVSVVSNLSPSEYGALLSGCWAYVQPSIYEGLCIPALDMAAAGVPLAASRLANLGRVFEGIGPVSLFDPFSISEMTTAIERLVHDAAVRSASSSWNKGHIALTDWHKVASIASRALQ